MLRQIEWRLQNGPITKSGVLPVTTLFFWKIWSSFRTSLKHLIWCTNDTNVYIRIFRKRWSLILGCFFPVSILSFHFAKNSFLWIKSEAAIKRGFGKNIFEVWTKSNFLNIYLWKHSLIENLQATLQIMIHLIKGVIMVLLLWGQGSWIVKEKLMPYYQLKLVKKPE